jgi:hypothetical protein
MTLYEISITNHSGYPWFKWKSHTAATYLFNTVRYTRYPTFSLQNEKSKFELECGYMAAMSMSARNQGIEIMSIKKRPLSVDNIRAEGTEQDIIFDITVDLFMNEQNLSYRMARTVEEIVYINERNLLESKEIIETEEAQIIEVFNDLKSTHIIHKNADDIFKAIEKAVKDVEEDAILGIGMLSSSYNILFYQGLKTYKDLSEKELEELGFFPSNEQELAQVLNMTQMPTYIEPDNKKNLYPLNSEYNFIIHNLGVGPRILGVIEPFHLIAGVKMKYPYESILFELIQSLEPYLKEEE